MAADSVLFFGWNRPIPGREKTCIELFGTALKFYAAQREAKKIDSFEPIVLTAHGGDLNGFILIRGSEEQLSKLRTSDEFQDLVTQVNMHASGVGVVHGFTGDGVQKAMARYQRNVK